MGGARNRARAANNARRRRRDAACLGGGGCRRLYGVDVTVVLDINHVVEYVWRRRMYSMTRAAPSWRAGHARACGTLLEGKAVRVAASMQRAATVAGCSASTTFAGRHVHGLPAAAGRRPPGVDAGHGLARAPRGRSRSTWAGSSPPTSTTGWGTGRPGNRDAVCLPDAVGQGLPGNPLRVALGGRPAVQPGGRG